jgi:hypothetical protein
VTTHAEYFLFEAPIYNTPASPPTLRRGSRGPAVRELQQRLNARGARLDPNGVFGPGTETAVRAFQRANGLQPDGIAGPLTWGRLRSAEPPPAPTPPRPAPVVGDACLRRFPAPAALRIPARDLTRREARDVLVYLAGQGAFTLKPTQSPIQFDSSCTILRPQPSTRITIEPAVIDGVRFVARGNPRQSAISNLDVRMVVGLYRLAQMLRTRWGVTAIGHMGIGQGRGASDDCHNSGRAIDFAGVEGVYRGQQYMLDVQRDWGNQPVTLPNGAQQRNWPADFRATSYRLTPGGNALAYGLFRDVYELATREFTDTNPQRLGNAAPTQIGQSSRFIIHPDHPSSGLRSQHQNHMHIQIGSTRAEPNPP